ncbi:protein trichome berefringence-like 7 [Coffea arabica]|uniref:Protein trichome berefringence-like 7 n=1 Tax=Coffea arabica TaxID=13443 RepID=A0A6P6TKA8_COFAR|nr:protein trichome berefringence-like 7 [Coffea arabica]XP_027077961.1 protein trichome berefringence-like 7 [Coffea arabica]XP_027077962.1 protein trichome berefringence-like 7 [Coffea arabica]XP_027077963.1 protein trichome berefringence-like 7 [Coffea arabica]
MSSLSRTASLKQRTQIVGSPRAVASPRITRKSWNSGPVLIGVVIGLVVSFFLAVGLRYLYVLPSLTQAFHDDSVSHLNDSGNSCDVFDGNWVLDYRYPLYNASECPFVEQGFNCLENGRMDKEYLKWRWKPKNCDIPRFNVMSILEMFRNRRIVFVGDSMSRTQWESLICMLMTGVEDKRSVYEVNGSKITKQIRFLGVRFSSFNFTIEFYRSVFLVQHSWAPKRGPKRVRSTLKLDELDDISDEWINTDVLIFNSGQWWVPGKLFGTGCYFQIGNSLKLGMSIGTAFRTALGTWSSWVDTMINPNRTRVFFRTFEPSHWSGDETLRLCNMTSQPLSETEGKDSSPFSDTVFDVVKNMAVPVTVLHITPLSAFRRDAHVGIWSDKPNMSDCSHWCLPGVPDIWNEILFQLLPGFKDASSE